MALEKIPGDDSVFQMDQFEDFLKRKTSGPEKAPFLAVIWFHAPLRWDNWLQYSLQSPIAANSRGLAFGAFYDLQQQPVATVAQQGSLRYQPV